MTRRPTGFAFERAAVAVAEVHTLDLISFDVDAPRDAWVVATCGCHNPDELGEGRMDFRGDSIDSVAEQWADHVYDIVEKEKSL